MKKIFWGIMTFFAVGVGAYAIAIAFLPATGAPIVESIFKVNYLSGMGHFIGGGIVLAIGAFQMSTRLRERFPGIHRMLGTVYVIGVVVGGIAAFKLALSSFGGMVTHFGFGALAVLWLGTTIMAYWQIRQGNYESHEQWMIRSYALTLAAVTLRIYIPLSQIAGIPFPTAYAWISWLCWVPNLVLAEAWLMSRKRQIFTSV